MVQCVAKESLHYERERARLQCVCSGPGWTQRMIAAAGHFSIRDISIHYSCIDAMLGFNPIVLVTQNMLRASGKSGRPLQ